MRFNFSLFFKDASRFLLRKLRLFVFNIWQKTSSTDDLPADDCEIDVVIAVIEKDMAALPLCIEGLRKNLAHTIKNIYLVAPANEKIENFAEQHGLIFTQENTVLGYTPASINYVLDSGFNRSGWIFQQLIKLSGKIGTCRHFLVIDADHILLKRHIFLSGGKTIFYQSFDNNIPYYNNIKRLLGFYPVHWFSYVSHKMFFDKEQLQRLHEAIEKRSQCSWDTAIIRNLKTSEHSDFSEFELYGHFMPSQKKIHLPWKELPLHIDKLSSLEILRQSYPGNRSVTFSSYLQTPGIKFQKGWKRYWKNK